MSCIEIKNVGRCNEGTTGAAAKHCMVDFPPFCFEQQKRKVEQGQQDGCVGLVGQHPASQLQS